MSSNPFVFERAITGGEEGLAYLPDAPAIDRIVDGLLLGKYYTLLGPRLSGVTSLHRAVLHRASQRERHCYSLYVDLQAVTSDAGEASLFAGITAACEMLPAEIAPPFAGIKDGDDFRRALLAIVRDRPARLILALDHLDSETLPFESARALVRWARVLYNQRLTDGEHGKISVLIGGAHSPYALSTGSGSPFNIAEQHWVDDLTPDEIRQLIRAGEELGAPRFDEGAIERVIAASQGDKYFVQRICHLCVQRAREKTALAVTGAMADGVVERLAAMDSRGDGCFEPLLKSMMSDADLVEIVAGLLDGQEALTNEYQTDRHKMQLSGLLRIEGDRYRFRNEVYRRFFQDPARREMVRQGRAIHAQARGLARLHEAALDIASTLDPDRSLKKAAWTVLRATRADAVALYLLEGAGRLRLAAAASSEELPGADPVLERDEAAREALASGTHAVVEEWAFCRGLDPTVPRTCVWLPLPAGRDVIGVMAVGFSERRAIPPNELQAAEILASHVAVAAENTRLYQDLQQARRALDDSLHILTHQVHAEPAFVTNTVAILLAGKLGDLNELQRDRLQKAQRRLDDYHRLVESLNMYGRLRGGKLIPKKEQIKPAQVIREAIRRRRAEIRRHGLTLKADIRRLPSLEADRGMIETILANLLDNAIKFTPEGGAISVEAWSDPQNLHIAVEDTGRGIPLPERERVFDEYYQVGRVPSRAQEGAGLGLYITRRFVEMHAGQIRVAEKDGPGTRIEVTLPRQ